MSGALRFITFLLSFFAAVSAHADKRIALTFDDAPRPRGAFLTPEERTEILIGGLREAGVEQAAFFVTPGFLDEPDGEGGEARIAAYVAAGHVIANHSFSHTRLSLSSAEDYLADLDRAGAWLKDKEGVRPWFRFPNLDEGGRDKAKRDAVRAGIAKRGLRNGYVTAGGSDWFLEDLSISAAKADCELDMDELGRLFVTTHVSGAEYADALARKTIGRSPDHVLLLHETDVTAIFLTDLVAELRRQGWTIITADEAYRDPLEQIVPDPPVAIGWLTQVLAAEKGIERPAWPIWIHPGLAANMFRQTVLSNPSESCLEQLALPSLDYGQ